MRYRISLRFKKLTVSGIMETEGVLEGYGPYLLPQYALFAFNMVLNGMQLNWQRPQPLL